MHRNFYINLFNTTLTMQRTKATLLLLFSCLLCLNTLAQQDPGRLNLPTIIPPSPASQNFMRYGEIPVDYSTGVPNISIPLYTAKSRQLSLPISISYHGSGIKVQDKASVIGLGWVLNAGGLVTVTLLSGNGNATYKSAEAFNAGRLAVFNTGVEDDIADLANTIYNEVGQKPFYTSNRYSFSLPNGESGVFRYDYITGNLVKLPYSPVQISPGNSSGLTLYGPFTITDENGVIYTFNPYTTPAGQTWNISSMISADKTDTIRFTYKSAVNMNFTPAHTSALQLYEYPTNTGGSNVGWTCAQSLNNSIVPAGVQTYEQLLDSVITSNTVVTFAVANDRQDMSNGTGQYRVTGMSIFDRKSGGLIKSYDFNQDYFGSSANNNLRLRLSGLTVKGNDGVGIENYSFVYDNSVELPPYPENIPGIHQFAEDYWGYYNGNPSYSKVPMQFVPAYVPNYRGNDHIPVTSDNYTNRDPNALYAKAAMLKEIDYPTGGKTVFTFEPNQAANAYQYPAGFTVPDIVGGFRIQQISNYSNDGTLTDYKSYTYGAGNTRPIGNDLFSQTQRAFVGLALQGPPASTDWLDYTELIISSDSFLPLTCDNGPPVLYTSVTEYEGGASGTNSGKTDFTYQTPPLTVNLNAGYEDPQYTGSYYYDMGNYVPQLLDKKVYKYVSDGVYTPVKEIQNAYTTFLTQSYPMGYHMVNMNSYPSGDIIYDYFNLTYHGVIEGYYGTPQGYNGYQVAADLFIAEDVSATQQLNLPTQTTEFDYDPSGTQSVAKTTNISYGGLSGYTLGSQAHLQPTQKTINSSTSDSFSTNYTYPSDYSTTAPYNTMLSRNILNPVIQQSNYKNSTFLNLVKTNYYQWDTNIIAPQTVQTQTGSTAAETRITYNSYDTKGNVTGVSKTGGAPISYQWDYNKTYPVSQATNASANDIFYDSFEDGDGTSGAGDAKTGHYSYSGSPAYAKTLNGLDNGSYLLTYWLKTAGVWSFQATTVSVVSGAYTISLSGQIDDVRFYPTAAQMTTYTYDPLVGLTSITDTKGEISYYEYDTFQRLTNIKDKDGNIIKSFCYNYAGQAYGCNVPAAGPPPVNVSFSLSNGTGIAYQVYFSAGANNYTFNLPNNGTSTVQVPAGVYWVNVYPMSGTIVNVLTLDTLAPVYAPRANFSNVTVTTGGSNTLSVQPNY
jgi:YD repeat-containing protein